jgi:miniconductance mechanosensitive channel
MNFITQWVDKLEQLLTTNMPEGIGIATRTVIVAVIIFSLAILADIITRKIILTGIKRIVRKSKTKIDDILIERGVFRKLAHLIPGFLIYSTAEFIFSDYPVLSDIVTRLALISIIIILLLAIDSFINALHQIYLTMPVSEGRPIKGYVQVVKIIIYFIAIIMIIAVLAKESPNKLLTGLGAMAAVLMLVFKDTILGFVASIQLSANKMVKPGDWIEMPSHNADGPVIDISLNTVKVQNWDKTIATVPTYALVSESFRNWKGMEESGGRRIKRSINIDMNSVRFVDDEMAEKFKKIQVLSDYVVNKEEELQKYNEKHKIDGTILVNGRRMTNLGTFRKYVEEYLHRHPKIHNDMTFLVRQLQPDERGLPIEIYVFSNDQEWANYESIQSDIFDHILAVIPEFDLRVFQSPSGRDFQNLASQ